MSGPKTSRVKTAAEIQAEIEAEIEREKKAKETAIRNMLKAKDNALEAITEMSSILGKLIDAEKTVDGNNILSGKFKKKFDTYSLEITAVVNKSDIPTETVAINEYSKRIRDVYSRFLKQFKDEINPSLAETEKLANTLKVGNKIAMLRRENLAEKEITFAQAAAICLASDNAKTDKDDKVVKPVSGREAKELIMTLEKLINSGTLTEKRIAQATEYAAAIYNLCVLGHVSVSGTVEVAKRSINDWIRDKENFDKAYGEYLAQLSAYRETGAKYKAKPKAAFKGLVNAVYMEKARIAKAHKDLKNRNYVLDKLDKVMVRHGYQLGKSVALSPRGENIFNVCLDGKAAVHTYMSSDSSEEQTIMLEIVGIKKGNSIGRAQASPVEKECLYNRQVAFCKMHQELVNELKNEGITFEEENYRAPDRKYSSNYTIDATDDTTEEIAEEYVGIDNDFITENATAFTAYIQPKLKVMTVD